MDKVSIITPCHNSAPFVLETIKSISEQTFTNWEHILVDDASTDDTWQIIQKYCSSEPRAKCFRLTKNSGAALARNMAIEAAQGRYIAFIDSDDLWMPEKLEKQIEFMRYKNAYLSFSSYEKINEYGVRSGRMVDVPNEVNYNEILKGCVIGCLTAMYDSKYLGKVYMPDIRRGQDYGLWLRILRRGHIAYGLNCPLALYRERSGSISSSKFKKAYSQWRIYRNIEKLSLICSLKNFFFYSYKGFKKKII
ncbi:glycosyltransferase [Syntrophotalea carbinolica DSM 2380]|uniref:Glycosyltransferase n=1 Tax=Syntrophotalea carbinolica (strain DSM 2380 / NBRC 103641 / GraBd1) TaxID=338963 RepID=Q3A3M0_SYNC1|nr:glycosyltransferase family 2 protein [Syntrophotalea carbinolica]ABA89037.1 glycosyltransferase [Syntrophotalea carbinolica DSM 2380]